MERTEHRNIARIEESILPSVSMLLDTLLDTAAAARPGIDSDAHATEIRTLASYVDYLSRQVAAISPLAAQRARARISA
jgi:hypothetical protein